VTSHEAALEQRPAKVGAVQRVILDHFGPLTDEQLVARFDEYVAAAEDAPVTPQSVRTRRVELVLDEKENLHRTDLNPIEQARGFARALELLEISQTLLARRLEISQPQISNTLRLLALPAAVQDLVAAGAVSAAQARELLRLDDEDAQLALATQIVEMGLTVRQTAERREATASPAQPAQRGDFSQLLADLRSARGLVTLKGGRARITIDVQEADVDRVLDQLGRNGLRSAA
jgi:ParB-like chromosome segregation protein Spo0J